MPKVSIYTRATIGGSRRRYTKAIRGSTGPFFLRYEINGKRVLGSIHTRTYTFALAAARTKESSLLLGEATPHTPSPLHVQPKAWRKFRLKDKSKKRSPQNRFIPIPAKLVWKIKDRMRQRNAMPHDRKTYADTLHEEGVSVNTIRIRLGHESLDVTLA